MSAPLRDWVIGIDPSLTGTGIAIQGRTWTVRKGSGDQRLRDIHIAVSAAIRQRTGRGLAVVEDLPANAMGAGLTALAHGVVRLALVQTSVDYTLMTPASLKQLATGRGIATKADMRVELLNRTGEDIRDDNQVDAFFLREAGLAAIGDPTALAMPKRHTDALLKVKWPEDIAAALLKPFEAIT